MRKRAQRGQGTVEFVLVSFMLVFFLMLSWQMAWVACQKWYFNYTAAYAARTWSVKALGTTTSKPLEEVELWQIFRKPNIINVPFVRPIFAGTEDADKGGSDDDDLFGAGSLPPGIRYSGYAQYLLWFQPAVIESAHLESGSLTGLIRFETYIPIEHEESFDGPEDPEHNDNDRDTSKY